MCCLTCQDCGISNDTVKEIVFYEGFVARTGGTLCSDCESDRLQTSTSMSSIDIGQGGEWL